MVFAAKSNTAQVPVAKKHAYLNKRGNMYGIRGTLANIALVLTPFASQ